MLVRTLSMHATVTEAQRAVAGLTIERPDDLLVVMENPPPLELKKMKGIREK